MATIVLFRGAYALAYVMTNIDGISYMRIAEMYANGWTFEAINAFWSPLISWSMLPFMAAGVATTEAFALASATWSSIGLAAATFLVWRWSRHNFIASLVVGVSCAALYIGNLPNQTPDLLVVTWTILFALVLIEANERMAVGTLRARVGWGVILGTVAAIGYYSKAFALPVLVVVTAAWIAIRLIHAARSVPASERRTQVIHRLWMPVATIVTIALLMAPFVIAMSVKYGGPTVGSSWAVNMQGKFGGSSTTDEEPQPSLDLPAPPSEHAISYGDDRTATLTETGTTGAAPSSLAERAGVYLNQRFVSFPYYAAKLQTIAPFGLAILAVFLALTCFGIVDLRRHRAAVIVASVASVYVAGYAAILSSETYSGNLRYHWPILPLTTIVFALMWPSLWRFARERNTVIARVLAAVLIAVVPVSSVLRHGLAINAPFSAEQTYASARYVVGTPEKTGWQKHAEKMLADGVIKPGDSIVASTGQKDRTLLYAWYMRAQLFGIRLPHDISDPRFQQRLRDLHIDYYFLYEPTESAGFDVSSFGTVVKTYEMPYRCGLLPSGESSAGCRLSIVAVTP